MYFFCSDLWKILGCFFLGFLFSQESEEIKHSIEKLYHIKKEIRAEGIQELKKIGLPALPALLETFMKGESRLENSTRATLATAEVLKHFGLDMVEPLLGCLDWRYKFGVSIEEIRKTNSGNNVFLAPDQYKEIAVEVLYELGPDVIPLLLKHLHQIYYPATKKCAMRTLARFGEQVIPHLLSLEEDPNYHDYVLKTLGVMPNSIGLESLFELLQKYSNPASFKCVGVVEALGEAGKQSPKACEVVFTILKKQLILVSKTKDLKEKEKLYLVINYSLKALEKIEYSYDPLIQQLLELAQMPIPESKIHAQVLGTLACLKTAPEQTLPLFLEALESSKPAYRKNALRGLAKLNPKNKEIISKIIKVLKESPQSYVLKEAFQSLGTMDVQTELLENLLIELILENHGRLGEFSFLFIARKGTTFQGLSPIILEKLEEALAQEKFKLGFVLPGLIALSSLKTEEGLAFRDAALREHPDLLKKFIRAGRTQLKSKRTKEASLDALKFIGSFGIHSKALLPEILAELKNPSEEMVLGTIQCLMQLAPVAEEAIPHLIKLVQNRKGKICQAAILALGEFGPKSKTAIPVLEKKMQQEMVFEEEIQSVLRRIQEKN